MWATSEVKHLGPELLALWPSVKAVAAVERVREVTGKEPKVSTERHYYILSDNRCNAQRAGAIIRGHWSIENGLRRLTANLLRLNPTKRSIRGQRKRCGGSNEYLFKTLFRGLDAPQP